MKLSIRGRILLALNLTAALVTLLTGWIAVRISDRAVEQRLLDDAVRNTAALVEQWRLPLSPRLIVNLSRIFDAHVAVWQADTRTVSASTLSAAQSAEFAHAVGGDSLPRTMRVGSTTYGMAHAHVARSDGQTGAPSTLCLLMDASRIQIVQRRFRRHIVGALAVVLTLASLAGAWLAHSITRPLRTISRLVNELASKATAKARDADAPPPASVRVDAGSFSALADAPPELTRLLRDVDGLLGALGETQETLAREGKLAALGRFSSTVAHELRNPLSGIAMNAQLLSKALTSADGAAPRIVSIIRDETRRMQFFLDELLSAVASGRPVSDSPTPDVPPPASCEVDAVVERVIEFMASRFAAADIALHWHNDGCARLACAAIELEQVLFNLTMNAVDAMPAGGRLELAARIGANGFGELLVIDPGPGLSESVQARLFEPFVTTKARGTGLGLYVCKRLADRRGGHLEYRRERECTVFSFTIPVGAGDTE